MDATKIAICADDFGLSPAVNEAIVDLVRHDRITGVGVMSDGSATERQFDVLKDARNVDLGLHLNLAEHFGEQHFHLSLPGLMRSAFIGRLDRDQVSADIRRQLNRFEDRNRHRLNEQAQLLRWFGNANNGDVLMVHPANDNHLSRPSDRIRWAQFGALRSDALTAFLARHGIVVRRWSVAGRSLQAH